ncbi:MAG: hypothetical protein D6748_06075 [Calditrichaeota bacterium]|nr:MAG: hypothetical protein D6748_06075 [Calditrichota bacterium]
MPFSHLKYWLISLIIMVTLFSCSEKTGPLESPPEYSIQLFQAPTFISIDRPRSYTVSFQVTHPRGLEHIASVTCRVFAADQTTEILQFPLYDDGAAIHPEDRDVVAGDGIFTATFLSDSSVFSSGTFYFQGEVTDDENNNLLSNLVASQAIVNTEPVLITIHSPDTLPSGTEPLLFSAVVQDSNGIEDVSSVQLSLKQGGNVIATALLDLISESAPDTGLFGIFLDSTFAAERMGDYLLEYQAQDNSGDLSNVLTASIYLENLAPTLRVVELPDSFQRPPIGTEIIDVRVRVVDPQGLADISNVSMSIYRAGGDTSFIELFDDGDFANHRDQEAGDGIFSRGLLVAANSTADLFIFEFLAEDRVGNFSPVVNDSLRILP